MHTASIATRTAPRSETTPYSVVGYTIVDSPVGRLLVGATPRGICTVRLGESDAQLEAELRSEHPAAALRRDGEPLALWVNALLRHIAGDEPRLDPPLDVRATAFQRRVWRALRAIPYGATRRYGEIAETVGRPGAGRAVARACSANPVALVIPCHRVVRHDGDPGGYRWGVRRKGMLLEQERRVMQQSEQQVMRALLDAIGPTPAGSEAAGTPPASALSAGQLVAARYEILSLLGSGSMGVVYAARDRELDEPVALKVLRSSAAGEDRTALDRFKTELRLTRRISHPHVVRTHDIGEAAGCRFITMEYVDGWSLAQLLERRGTLPLPAALVVGKQLCRALDVVHAQGVIHRDIKPQNVLVTREGDVKLTDFGIAELERATPSASADEAPRGTLPYMAPEQLHGEPLDPRTDLYATAVVLVECLTGEPRYPGARCPMFLARALVGNPPATRELGRAVPRALTELLRAALSADRDARPAAASVFHDALAEIEWNESGPMFQT